MKFSFCMPLLIFLLSINLVIFDQSFYEKEMTDYEEYKNKVENLLEYFTWQELDKENYSEEEIFHLADVRRLIWISLLLLCLVSIPLVFSLIKDSQELVQKELRSGGIYTLVLAGVFSFALLHFSDMFVLFHKMVFTNQYWLLPMDSLLIRMFPERFFIESTKQILLYSLLFSGISIGIGLVPRSKKDEHKRA